MDITYASLDPLLRVVADCENTPQCPPLLGRAGMTPPESADAGETTSAEGAALEVLKPHAIVVRGAYALQANG